MKTFWHYDSPVGRLEIVEEDNCITQVLFSHEKPTGSNAPLNGYQPEESPLIKEACKQLAEYFAGQRQTFSLPLAPRGTPFQKAVWQALQAIPFGETRSYKDIAIAVGSPKGFRAVGMANNRNPIAIIVPCHRVIGHNKQLVGYAGGLDTKKFLLDLECGDKTGA